MADHANPSTNETSLHNSVLMRERAPHERDHRWVMVVPVVAVIALAGGFWLYVQAHPPAPLVNHAVAGASQAPWYEQHR
jgi:hypothetical protein